MMTLLIILGYLCIGVFVGWESYNVVLYDSYKNMLRDWDEFAIKYYKKQYRVGTAEDAAYKHAKRYSFAVPMLILDIFFWPVLGLWFLLYRKFSKWGIKLLPKDAVEKEIEDVKKISQEKEDLKKLIKDAQRLGLDVKELENFVRTENLES